MPRDIDIREIAMRMQEKQLQLTIQCRGGIFHGRLESKDGKAVYKASGLHLGSVLQLVFGQANIAGDPSGGGNAA